MSRLRGAAVPAGFSLLEALLAVMLLLVVLSAAGRIAAATRTTLEGIARNAEELDAVRVARTLGDHVTESGAVLGAGARADEVEVLFPVGRAVACDTAWAWAGVRRPDPARDSAVVLDGRARPWRVGVGSVVVTTCRGEPALAITLAPPVTGAVLIEVFERGVLRVDDAVRYARSGTSRQPLTGAVLDPSSSGAAHTASGLRLRLVRDTIRRWERTWVGRD